MTTNHKTSKTQFITLADIQSAQNPQQTYKEIMQHIYQALCERGYNPTTQIVGYLLSEDPTYITNHKNARALICKLDRYELLEYIIEDYIKK